MSTMKIIALLASTLAVTGCGLLFGGYDPNTPVSISVEADEMLNAYSGTAHRMDLYIYKLTDPVAFHGAAIPELLKVRQSVPGGQGISTASVAPGQESLLPVGAMGYEMYTHLGILAAYKEPEAGGEIRATVEIPRSARLHLVLGPNSIVSFAEAD
jgi:type VI secretion system VasD/TssJ family lipoprotein